ncbi:MAG: hypothetical protein KC419_19100 [Anaerolineales bacterium]|nr:hypothetical protein [Anaerolineales bacterium]MCA9930604.1 hypothetical protein [Anaerolineales bacterium]
MSAKYTIEVKKRPWYEWLLWLIWAAGLWFVLQNAVSSGAELESRAAGIFWVTTIVWLLAGVVVWFTRRSK